MTAVGTILKSQSGNIGTTFCRIVSDNEDSYTVKLICKVRKGFPVTKFENVQEQRILKTEIGFNFHKANKKDLAKIKDFIGSSIKEDSQNKIIRFKETLVDNESNDTVSPDTNLSVDNIVGTEQ